MDNAAFCVSIVQGEKHIVYDTLDGVLWYRTVRDMEFGVEERGDVCAQDVRYQTQVVSVAAFGPERII